MVRKRSFLQALEGIRVSCFCPCSKCREVKIRWKTKECVFLGYTHDDFGYKLWDLAKKSVFRSRVVIFFEDQNVEELHKESWSDDLVEEEDDIDPVVPLQ